MKNLLKRREAEDFQMAPMIDMVFLLLVFFMCVSSLTEADRGIEVDLPESFESKIPEELANRGSVTVKADGRVFLGGREVGIDELGDGIRTALSLTPGLRVQVRADSDAHFSQIQPVLKKCAEVGAVDLIYSTHQAR